MIAIVMLLSVCVPVLEVLIFSWIIDMAGIWPVILPSALTACAGAVLLIRKFPGFMNTSVNNDKFQTLPTIQSYSDLTWIVSGLLLLIPGFVSDIAALILLHPRLRGLSFVVLARLMASRNRKDPIY